MLKVNIEELTFDCIIGILPIERKREQRVVLNISFEYSFKDDGYSFIDYTEVVALVEAIMISNKFQLIEDAILYIRKKLKGRWKIDQLKVKISKPDILTNCIVSVEE
ncbi:Dihydroneopterin aldolase [hydrothermal vent metagenome]|uniref:dihydroneopterin aldolase n=1 Tax=hydrothermal vent metagenome TaxID=652676 RepID=A0A3B1EAA5_9ZZZZ